MGSLTLPAAGLVYFDTNPVIYSVEKHHDYWPLLQPLWQAAQGKTIEIASSDLVLMEPPTRCTRPPLWKQVAYCSSPTMPVSVAWPTFRW